MNRSFLEAIKSFEGFTPKASWDYAQFTNGYGTKALHPGEQITRLEADRRFSAEIEQARMFVERHASRWDEGTKAALTSLTFNCGTKWASSGLGEAVRNNDIEGVRHRFLAYTKAGGQDLQGLVKRRLVEATWIGGLPPDSVPTALRSEPQTTVGLGNLKPETQDVEPILPPVRVAAMDSGVDGAIQSQPKAIIDQRQISQLAATLLLAVELQAVDLLQRDQVNQRRSVATPSQTSFDSSQTKS